MISDYKVDYDIMVSQGVDGSTAMEICVKFNTLDELHDGGYLTDEEYNGAYSRLKERMIRLERV